MRYQLVENIILYNVAPCEVLVGQARGGERIRYHLAGDQPRLVKARYRRLLNEYEFGVCHHQAGSQLLLPSRYYRLGLQKIQLMFPTPKKESNPTHK